MKKLIAVMIACVLAISCMASAFAVTPVSTSSIDEAPYVKSITMTKLPTKTTYQFGVEAGWDFGKAESFADLLNLPFYINVDLSGAEIVAQLSNGSTQNVNLSDCTTRVVDPVSLSDFGKVLNEEEIVKLCLRDFTIEVTYKDVSTTFKVKTVAPDISSDDDEYEVVSINGLEKTKYVYGVDTVKEVYDDEEGSYTEEYVNINTDNMSVTLKNKKTGEIVNVASEDIYFDNPILDEDKPCGTYTVDATAFVDDNTDVEFSFDIEVVSKASTDNGGQSITPTKQNSSKVSSSTADETATKDTADNSVVNTGSPVTATVFVTILLSTVLFAWFCSKKKLSK